MAELDIVIPVYNEGGRIASLLDLFHAGIHTPYRVLICYDFEGDDTVTALKDYPRERGEVVFVRNHDPGPHGAVRVGPSVPR